MRSIIPASHSSLSLLFVAALAGCAGAPPPPPVTAPPPPSSYSLEAQTITRPGASVPREESGTAAAPGGEGSATPPAATATANTPSDPMERAVLQALNARQQALSECYEHVVHVSGDVTGRLAVQFEFAANGAVRRVDTRIEGTGGIGTARGCVETALRGARIEPAPGRELQVRRSYSFVNPPQELTLPPTNVTPAARRGVRAGIASAQAQAGSTTAPAEGGGPTGLLSAQEIGAVLQAALPEIQRCYSTVLRANRQALGDAVVDMEVNTDGSVASSTLGQSDASLRGIEECLTTGARALRFRASGTRTNLHIPLHFQHRE